MSLGCAVLMAAPAGGATWICRSQAGLMPSQGQRASGAACARPGSSDAPRARAPRTRRMRGERDEVFIA